MTGRFAATPDVIVRSWNEGLSVVFAPATNTTHLVTSEAGELLRRVGTSVAWQDTSIIRGNAELLDGLVVAGLLRRAG